MAAIIAIVSAVIVVGATTDAGWLDSMYPSTNQSAQCSDATMWDGGWLACQTDNAGLYYCYHHGANPVTNKFQVGIASTMTYTYSTTDLHVHLHNCVYTGSGETDIVYRELSTLPSNATGFAHCDDATSSISCDQHWVTVDKEKIAAASFNADKVWKLACHEAGHSVGLLHGSNSSPSITNDSAVLGCMVQGFNPVRKWLGSTNADQIDDTY